MAKLTNKAEFMDVCMDWLRDGGWTNASERAEWAERIWSRLVKRGLAEEQRQPGLYATETRGPDRLPAMFWDGEYWLEVAFWGERDAPAIIGPRIEAPKE